ncbi:hypothetical protein D041_3868B, partial [Vibrio parahaemolyticus EKP-008]
HGPCTIHVLLQSLAQ